MPERFAIGAVAGPDFFFLFFSAFGFFFSFGGRICPLAMTILPRAAAETG